ncbi:DUF596 domain-containing protein [Leucobacter viscericola]|uniref:DUF596 domain-containing protein n=1 Tax=Leucobacter viscericola TaxID=2714935 RepID=A0A6G7XDK7_9MICO|nr:DUF596 domain-containing protein [Leucobacter viscericola]QIK62556.1 DUF596 domain-containing protein [Leucobacter viscericola]
MTRFTTEQLLWMLEGADDSNLDSIWDYFDAEPTAIEPPMEIVSLPFEERREAFLELLSFLLEKGYIRFAWQWKEGEPYLTGSIPEQIQALREALPSNDEGLLLNDLPVWFFSRCPIDVVWAWPGRNPEPLFPGHNPRYTYIDPRASWDGRIDPEWSHWKFTPGRLRLDDFSSEEVASAFWKAHPNYLQDTPLIERIIE